MPHALSATICHIFSGQMNFYPIECIHLDLGQYASQERIFEEGGKRP